MQTHLNKVCIKCGEEKPLTAYKTDKRGTRNVCIQCRNFHLTIARKGKKKWIEEGREIPQQCDCCGKVTEKIVYDHDHITLKHRGWLCHPCNQGLGLLGDDVASLERAMQYLQTSSESGTDPLP